MKASAVFHALKALVVGERQPVFVWGTPGIGKSAVVHQLAAEVRVALRDIRALLLDPVDLRGLPFIGKDGRSQWATPDFLPQDGEGILFLDELNAAPAMVQASCYQLVLDRKVGEYTLPGRMGGCGRLESRFGPCRDDSDAHAIAEPFCAPRVRGRFAGMVGVGHSRWPSTRGDCFS